MGLLGPKPRRAAARSPEVSTVKETPEKKNKETIRTASPRLQVQPNTNIKKSNSESSKAEQSSRHGNKENSVTAVSNHICKLAEGITLLNLNKNNSGSSETQQLSNKDVALAPKVPKEELHKENSVVICAKKNGTSEESRLPVLNQTDKESDSKIKDKSEKSIASNINTELIKDLANLCLKESKDADETSESSDLKSRGRYRKQAFLPERPNPYVSQCHIDPLHCGGATVFQNNLVQQENGSLFQAYQLPVNTSNCGDHNIKTDYLPDITPEECLALIQQHPESVPNIIRALQNQEEDAQDLPMSPPTDISDLDKVILKSFDPQLEGAVVEELHKDACQVLNSREVMSPPIHSTTGFVSCVSFPPTPPGSSADEGSPVGSPAGTTILSTPNVISSPTPQQPGVLVLVSPVPVYRQQQQSQMATLKSQQNPVRPIKPGRSLPPFCTRSARERLRSHIKNEIKDGLWATLCAEPDDFLLSRDNDGNIPLSVLLINRNTVKNFPERLYTFAENTIGAIKTKQKQITENGPDKNFVREHDVAAVLTKPNKDGLNVLDLACKHLQGSSENGIAFRYLVELMLEVGVNVNVETGTKGNSLLHKVCELGDNAKYIMAELLSMEDISGNLVFGVHEKNNYGETPLHVAALWHRMKDPKYSCTVLAQLLVTKKASPAEQEGCGGNNALHYVARESCDPDFIVILLAHSQNVEQVVNKKNYNEDTPLHMVAANDRVDKALQCMAVQHLIENGAEPQAKNKSGKAPLALVAPDRKQDVKIFLYPKNSDVRRQY